MGFGSRFAVTKSSAQLSCQAVLQVPDGSVQPSPARYRITASVFNGKGESDNPDVGLEGPTAATVYFRLVKPDGSEATEVTLHTANSGGTVLADSDDSTNFPHAGTFWLQQVANVRKGVFECFAEVATGDVEQLLTLEMGWVEQGRVNTVAKGLRIGEVGQEAADEISEAVLAAAVSAADPAGSLSKAVADIELDAAAVLADTADMQPRVASMETDITAILVDTGTDIPASIAALNDLSAAVAADAVWDELLAGHVGALSFGKAIADIEVDAAAIKVETDLLGVPILATHALDVGAVQTDTTAILEDTGTTIPAQITALNNLSAADAADAVWDETLAGHVTGGTFGKAIADIEANAILILADTADMQPRVATTETNVASILTDTGTDLPALINGLTDLTGPQASDAIWDTATADNVVADSFGKAVVDILADTNELQTDWVNGGRLDALLDSVLAAVQAVQNNTHFTAVVKSEIELPDAGTGACEMLANLYDSNGQLSDPDVGTTVAELCVRIRQTAGTFITDRLFEDDGFTTPLPDATAPIVTTFTNALGWRIMKRDALGLFSMFYKNSFDDTDESLIFEFGWLETAVENRNARPVNLVVDSSTLETKIDTISTNVDALPTALTNADAVWDELLSAHVGALSFGAAVADIETDVTTLVAEVGSFTDVEAALSLSKIMLYDRTIFKVAASSGVGRSDQVFVIEAVTGGAAPSTITDAFYEGKTAIWLSGANDGDTNLIGTASQLDAVASGQITAQTGAITVDGDTFTLDDGAGNVVVFEFDDNDTVVESGTLRKVDFSAGPHSAIDMAVIIQDAINDVASDAAITGTVDGAGAVNLVNDAFGALGNTTITQSSLSLAAITSFTGGTQSGEIELAVATDVAPVTGEIIMIGQDDMTFLIGDIRDDDLNTLGAKIGDDPGQISLHSKVDYLGGGDFTLNTNLKSLLDYLGGDSNGLENSGVGIAQMLSMGWSLFQATSVSGSVITLTEVTGSARRNSTVDFYAGAHVMGLTGGSTGEEEVCLSYASPVMTMAAATGMAEESYILVKAMGLGIPGAVGTTAGVPNNSMFGLLGKFDDAATGAGIEGSVMSKLADIQAGGTSVSAIADGVWDELLAGHATADSGGFYLQQMGDMSGFPALFNTVAELLGQPSDAAVDPDSGNGSIFARLHDLEDQIVALAADVGTRKATFTEYLIAQTQVLSADPSLQAVDSGQNTSSLTYTALFTKEFNIPEGANGEVLDIFATLHHRDQGTNGGGTGDGDTEWVISSTAPTVDGSAALPAHTVISSVTAVSTALTERTVSGRVPDSGIPATGSFWLSLAAKVDNALDSISVDIYTDSNGEVTYQTP